MTERSARPIPLGDLARRPLPGNSFPVEVSFSPNGRVVTFLHDSSGGLERELFVLDTSEEGSTPRRVVLPGGRVREEELDLEEELRRQRERELGEGITRAVWAEEADALLVPLPDGIYVVRGLSEGGEPDIELVLPPERPSPVPVGPTLSPDGERLAFVRGGRLFVRPARAQGDNLPLTPAAEAGISYGVAEYVAQEEMDRREGFWWSKDSSLIAYTILDERRVPPFRIGHQGADDPFSDETHHYPFAGRANAVVSLAVVAADGGRPIELARRGDDEYLFRVRWLGDGRLLAFFENRAQTYLEAAAFTPPNWSRSLLYSEEQSPYLNLQDDFRLLADGSFLYTSERTGFRHLVLSDGEGNVRALTEGEWQVDALEGVDEPRGVAYVSATRDSPTERHLYEVDLETGAIRRLTPEAGTHDVVLGEAARLFVDRRSSLREPPVVTLRSLADSSVMATLHEPHDPRLNELDLEPPELVSLPAPDGSILFGLVFPAVQPASDPPPLAVQVYGGPHAQMAVNSWVSTTMMRAQALARLGVTVLVVDNRGSARRGLSFESSLWRRMGEVEVEDQVAGVRWAVESGRADRQRVAIYGWSYGGYMALRCLALAGDTFRAAVAGAPVTDWDGYDTHYTERYMGHPDDNPDGYRRSSVLARAGDIEGELLLVHGLLDENVHFRHTARLLDRLATACRRYSLLCFPGARHMPHQENDRLFLEREVIGWLTEVLGARSQVDAGASSKAAPT